MNKQEALNLKKELEAVKESFREPFEKACEVRDKAQEAVSDLLKTMNSIDRRINEILKPFFE